MSGKSYSINDNIQYYYEHWKDEIIKKAEEESQKDEEWVQRGLDIINKSNK